MPSTIRVPPIAVLCLRKGVIKESGSKDVKVSVTKE